MASSWHDTLTIETIEKERANPPFDVRAVRVAAMCEALRALSLTFMPLSSSPSPSMAARRSCCSRSA